MGRILEIDQEHPSDTALATASCILRAGGIVIFPTDTVYGVGMSVSPEWGPQRLFDVKGRDADKAIPLLISGPAALDDLGSDVPGYARTLARRFWPGALTLVVKAAPSIPRSYLAADGTIALRCPDSPFVLSLIEQVAGPLAVSSANTQGCPPPASFEALEERIKDDVDLVIDGDCTSLGVASTIVVCTGNHPLIVREGALSKVMIEEVADEGSR